MDIQIEKIELDKINNLRDASVELFIDDVGIVQQIIYKKKRKKREGETIQVLGIKNGKAIASFDPDGNLGIIIYETVWKRNRNLTDK